MSVRYLTPMGLILALVAITGVMAFDSLRIGAHRGPVYSVAAVRAGLERAPQAWLRRTVLVRGFLDGCPHPVCPGHEPNYNTPPLLFDPNRPADALPVVWAGPGPFLAVARRVPLLGAALPGPQVPHWGTAATYWVRLRAMPQLACGSDACYEAVLLGAAP